MKTARRRMGVGGQTEEEETNEKAAKKDEAERG